MASLLRSKSAKLRGHPLGADEVRDGVPITLDQYAEMLAQIYGDWQSTNGMITTTWKGEPAERIGQTMASLAQHAYKGNGLAFSIIAVRMVAFSLARFSWQRMRGGRPSDLFGTPALSPLEVPWPGGTTQDLLQRMLLDADLAGNSYVIRDGPYLARLRPDWVQIILEPIVINGGIVGYRKVGYTFHNGGIDVCPIDKVALFTASQVAHFAPTPDPDANYRGQSWLGACIREIQNDSTMERHKTRFFENAATPNLSVSLDKSVSARDFARFKEAMDAEHVGPENAYKTLYLGGGADVKVIGASFEQIQMNDLQGRGETRVAAAGGVPPVIVGLSEGLASASYSNYGQAMRRFAELTMASLWGNVAGSLATIMASPGSDVRLWYDTRDIAFLREDRTAAAEIQGRQAQTIRTLLDAGFEPDSVILAVGAEDWSLLVHSGLYSVQLQKPDTTAPTATPAVPAAAGTKSDGGLDEIDRMIAAHAGDIAIVERPVRVEVVEFDEDDDLHRAAAARKAADDAYAEAVRRSHHSTVYEITAGQPEPVHATNGATP